METTPETERAARAIYERGGTPNGNPWDAQPRSEQLLYIADARAALSTLLEPTADLVFTVAGTEIEEFRVMRDGSKAIIGMRNAKAIISAAIRAAIGEDK